MAPGPEAWPRGGLGPGRAGPGGLLASPSQPLSGQRPCFLLPRPSPPPAPPLPRGGLGGLARPCHVYRPARTHEHLSKFPVGGAERRAASGPPPRSQCQMRAGDKSSISLISRAGGRPPSAARLLAALPRCPGGQGPGHASQDEGRIHVGGRGPGRPRASPTGAGTQDGQPARGTCAPPPAL